MKGATRRRLALARGSQITPHAIFGSMLLAEMNPPRLGLADGAGCPVLTDLSGHGISPAQATSAKRPLFYVDPYLGGYLRFNGSSQYLRVATPALPHPLGFYILYRINSDTTTNQYVFDGGTTNNQDAFITLQTVAVWGQTKIYAGANVQIGTWANSTWQIYYGVFNGASSSLTQDRAITTVAGVATNSGNVGATSGTGLTIGANGVATPTASSYASMDLARLYLISGVPSAAQNTAMLALLRKLLPTNLIFVGDSMTYGTAATNKPEGFAALVADHFKALSINAVNLGVSGKTVATMLSDAATQVPLYAQNSRPLNTVVIFGGTNDFGGGAAAATVYANLVALCQAWRASGAKVVVCTMLPRDASLETKRVAYNNSIIANWATFADALADFSSDASMGQAGQNTDTTYYNADALHPNTTGHATMAPYVYNAMTWMV